MNKVKHGIYNVLYAAAIVFWSIPIGIQILAASYKRRDKK